MKWLLTFLVFLTSSAAVAQDVYEFQHIPKGVVIEHDGVQYMAYDIETFRELAQVDNDYAMCLEMRETDGREIQALLTTVSSLRAIDVRQQELLSDARASLEAIANEEPAREPFLHPIHTPIQVVLLFIAGWAIAN